MAKYRGPKDRVSRREGIDVYGKGSKLTRLNVPPGVHGAKRRPNPSAYGKQLREKQKAKRIYGVLERQFKKYVEGALKSRGNSADKLFYLLESRLDNVVYRLAFVPSRPAARQLVSHKHVLVNAKKVNVPSYRVKVNDVITLDKIASEIPAVKKKLEEKNVKIPDWLKRKATVGTMTRKPGKEDVFEPISEADIIEFYSR